jgi:hypothetical protein
VHYNEIGYNFPSFCCSTHCYIVSRVKLFKNIKNSQAPMDLPVILAAQEAEIRRIVV